MSKGNCPCSLQVQWWPWRLVWYLCIPAGSVAETPGKSYPSKSCIPVMNHRNSSVTSCCTCSLAMRRRYATDVAAAVAMWIARSLMLSPSSMRFLSDSAECLIGGMLQQYITALYRRKTAENYSHSEPIISRHEPTICSYFICEYIILKRILALLSSNKYISHRANMTLL